MSKNSKTEVDAGLEKEQEAPGEQDKSVFAAEALLNNLISNPSNKNSEEDCGDKTGEGSPDDDDCEHSDYDAVYDVVHDHFRTFFKRELEELGIKNRELDDEEEELFWPFQVATDKIIRARAVGDLNELHLRKKRNTELDQLTKIVEIFRAAHFDELSTELLKIAALRNGYNGNAIRPFVQGVNGIASIFEDEECIKEIEETILFRKKELETQDGAYGRKLVTPIFVANQCRIIWHTFTGKIAPDTFKNLDQHFPQFVSDIFKALFSNLDAIPSVRTALEKSAPWAINQIDALSNLLTDQDIEKVDFDVDDRESE